MAYVITQPCCNDASCVDVCPVNCIHPTPDEAPFATTEMLYIDPDTCIDCGACVDECPVEAIFPDNELDEDDAPYLQMNASYFEKHPMGPDWPEPITMAKIDPELGTLKVAIVGSGPAACYAAMELTGKPRVEVDMFDRLPTPYGLVRAGVAPDHPGTKGVTDQFRAVVAKKTVRCHFNVEVGTHISHSELLDHHHAVIYAVGAAGDRKLEIPGEDLPGSHAATEFVAWYNGHPGYADRTFDLSGERAVIVGNGNVALDVARILVTDPDQLAKTDLAEHALEALRNSKIREVVILGRRGPAQAAYTNPELLALGQMANVDVVVDPIEAELDEASQAFVDSDAAEPSVLLKVKQAQEFASRTADPSRKRIVLRFLTSPVEVLGDGAVSQVRIVKKRIGGNADRSALRPAYRNRGDDRHFTGASVGRIPRHTDGRLALRRRSRRDPQRERQSNRHRDRHADPGCLRRGLDQARTDWRDRHQQVLLRRDRVDDLRRLRWWAPRHPDRGCRQVAGFVGRPVAGSGGLSRLAADRQGRTRIRCRNRTAANQTHLHRIHVGGCPERGIATFGRTSELLDCRFCVLMTMEMCGLLSSACSGV